MSVDPADGARAADAADAAAGTASAERLRVRLAGGEGSSGLTPARIESLLALLAPRALEARPGLRLVTLEGAPGGGAFCEGLSLEAVAGPGAALAAGPGAALATEPDAAGPTDAPGPADPLARFAALLDAIGRAPCPVVALVDGPAQGGGLGLAAACDLVIATPRARFGLPETVLGLVPAMVLPHVARRVGIARARLLGLGLVALDAAPALAWGLVDEVADDLEGALGRHARRLARLDARAVGAVKDLCATFYAAPAGYEAAAAARFHALLGSAPTRARLRRTVAGEPAWLGDGDAGENEAVAQAPATGAEAPA